MDFNLGILDDARPCSIPTGIAASSSWNTPRTGPSSIGDSLSRRMDVAKTRPSELKMDKPTAIPTSIEQPTPKSEDVTADITGTDPVKVRRALNMLDPARVLRDLEKPSRPAWTEILHDWAEIDMPRSVFEPWEVRQLERDSSVYWEYDAKRQRLGIRCVPTAIHEAPPDSFRAQAFQELSQLSKKSQDLFRVGSNTEFNGFDFPEYPISRSKEPDAFIMVWGGRFPLVVLESGFSERESSLVRGAQLWLYGGHAAVKFAVIVIITESKPICDDNQSPRRQLKDGEADELLSDGTKIPEGDNAESEPSTSDQLQFAGKLRRLHEEKRLMRPLLGDIQANLRVYRKAREGDDEGRIHRSNDFTEHPIFLKHDSPIYPDAGRNAVGMQWREIMEDQVESLGGRDKNRIFTLKPQKFKTHIQDAIRQTVEKRSNERARVILKQRGRLEQEGNESYEPKPSESSSGEEQGPSKKRKVG